MRGPVNKRKISLLAVAVLCVVVITASFGEAAITYSFSANSRGWDEDRRDLLDTPCFDGDGYGDLARNRIRFYHKCGGLQGGRGFNVAVINQLTGDVEDVPSTFDLFGGGEGEATRFLGYLHTIQSGRIILLAIGDEGGLKSWGSCDPWPYAWVEQVYAALESLGSLHIREVCYRQSWAMIAKQGAMSALAEAFGTGLKSAAASIRSPGVTLLKAIDYGPYRDGQAPTGSCPTADEITSDVAILKNMGNRVRTYALVECDLGEKILGATTAAGIRTYVGLWLRCDKKAGTCDEAAIRQEINKLSELLGKGLLRRTDVVVVGNEAISRDGLTVAKLTGYMNDVRAIVSSKNILVTTSETWNTWLDHPDLVAASDYMLAHFHPYWEGMPIGSAVNSVLTEYSTLWQKYPTERIVITETNWPTAGADFGDAHPSLENQHTFLKQLICRAIKAKVSYFVFEAFDEAWKTVQGEVEGHWGLYYSNRLPKQTFETVLKCPS